MLVLQQKLSKLVLCLIIYFCRLKSLRKLFLLCNLKNEVPYSSRILTFEKGGKVTQFFLGKKESIIKIWQKLQVKIGKKYLSE